MGSDLVNRVELEMAAKWALCPATTADVLRWSYGAVLHVPDLYDPRIFGPRCDLACECGKHTGDRAVGIVCDECGVLIASDAESLRKLRLGHVDLVYPCPNPFDSTILLNAWPVAPVWHRRRQDGTVTEVGLKYEALVNRNNELAAALPPRGTTQYYEALKRVDPEPVVAAISDIIGEKADEAVHLRPDCLISLLVKSLISMDFFTIGIARSCCMALRVAATL